MHRARRRRRLPDEPTSGILLVVARHEQRVNLALARVRLGARRSKARAIRVDACVAQTACMQTQGSAVLHGAGNCMRCGVLTARPAEIGQPRADIAHCVRPRRLDCVCGSLGTPCARRRCGQDVGAMWIGDDDGAPRLQLSDRPIRAASAGRPPVSYTRSLSHTVARDSSRPSNSRKYYIGY